MMKPIRQALCHNMDSEYYLDKMISNLELSQANW